MAGKCSLLVSCFERLLVSRKSTHIYNIRAFSQHTNVVSQSVDHVEPVYDHPRRYNSQKMANLFDNVRDADDDEGIVSAELSGIASSIAGVCWHKDALSDFVELEGQETKVGGDGGNYNSLDGSGGATFTANKERDTMLEHMKVLIDNDRQEKERIRAMLVKQQKLPIGKTPKHVTVNRDVSTMKLLKIASEISGRQPAHGKPQFDERKARREHAYYKNVNKGSTAELPEVYGYYKNKRTSSTELIRVLDVDALPLTMVHHMVCYTMVKHMPAETVLQVISRIAMLRDTDSHVAYQNLLRDLARIASPLCRAEIVALLSRCYQSISVPFMVDYVRRFGTFSRRFMAKLIQTHSHPLPLDFLRYRAGQRSMNQILTRPWALFGYVKLLKKSSSKTYMYHNLLARGYVPNETVFDRFHTFGTLDAKMATTILNSERMLNSTVQFDAETARVDPDRPRMYEEVLEAHALGLPLEDVHEEAQVSNMDQNDDSSGIPPSAVATQLVKIQTEIRSSRMTQPPQPGFRDVEDDLPVKRTHISWTTPWGRKRDVFHFRGKTYAMDAQHGWRMVKSVVRPPYLQNVKRNKRKRQMKALRRTAAKLARKTLASRMM